jgi:subtilase family serine protease
MPSYQTTFLSATKDPVLALNGGKRGIPDVAYNADATNSPIAVYVKGGWYGIGGTSEGAPQWAAIVARLGQYLQTQGSSAQSVLATNQGFNAMIYQTKIAQASKASFFDITTGSDDASNKPCVICSATAGYDDAAGLGVPNVGNLLGYF